MTYRRLLGHMRRGWSALVLIPLAASVSSCRGPSSSTSSAAEEDPEILAAAARGEALFFGRAGCNMCHRVGDRGVQIVGPNLGVGDGQFYPVGLRERHDGLRGIEYVVESIVDPDAFVVPGYARGVMKRYEEPPISLTDDEILALATFVAGQGGAPRIDPAAVTRARARIDSTRRARGERDRPEL